MKRGPVIEFHDDGKAHSQNPPIHLDAPEVQVETPEARAARLLVLSHAIASGIYSIPAEAVANKVMDRMRSRPSFETKATSEPTSAGPRGRSVAELEHPIEPAES